MTVADPRLEPPMRHFAVCFSLHVLVAEQMQHVAVAVLEASNFLSPSTAR